MINEKKPLKNVDRFLVAVSKISKVFSSFENYTGDTSLSKIELMTLEYIMTEQKFIMSNLANNLRIAPSRATGIIDHLVSKELVSRERNGVDRRVVKLFLTKKGEEILVSFQNEKKKMLEKMFNILNEKEQENFTLILEKVSTEFEKEFKNDF